MSSPIYQPEWQGYVKLAGLVDKWTIAGPGKMFISKGHDSDYSKKKVKKIHHKIKSVLIEIHTRKLSGNIAKSNCVLYDALTYKFGRSNRHQTFWRITLKIYRELKRLNSQDISTHFSVLSKRMEQSKFIYAPTKRAIRLLGAILIRRILQLDKLRLICAQSADSSMGYIELGHFLTFNLMCIAIASDVAAEARQQMRQLIEVYEVMGDLFHKCSKCLPAKASSLKLRTINSKLNLKHKIKRLKRHDFALLRQQIEGIEQETTNDDKLDFPITTKNLMQNPLPKISQRRFLTTKSRRKSAI